MNEAKPNSGWNESKPSFPERMIRRSVEQLEKDYQENHVHCLAQIATLTDEGEALAVQLHAWCNAFGTSQLSHATERLRVAEAERDTYAKNLADAQADIAHEVAERDTALAIIAELREALAQFKNEAGRKGT